MSSIVGYLDRCIFAPAAGGTSDWTVSAAVTGYQTPAQAGAVDGTIYRLVAESADKTQWEIAYGASSSSGTVFARTTIVASSTGSKVSFSVAPNVMVSAISADFDLAPFAAMAFNNATLNPACDVSQENGAATITLVNNTAKYIADQWEVMYNHGAATAVVISQQEPVSSLSGSLPAFANCLLLQAPTAITSPANGDFAKIRQKIEGYRIARWGWGASGAAQIVVCFELISNATFTGLLKLSNSDQSRCYYHEIAVVSGVNFYAIPIPGDTTGTWQATTSTGLTFEVFASGKEATPASSLDAWGATNKIQSTNSGNGLGTNNNYIAVTGLFIAASTKLPASADLPGLMRPYNSEIWECKRYLQLWQEGATTVLFTSGGTIATTQAAYVYLLERQMRVAPSLTVKNQTHFSVNAGGGNTVCTALAIDGTAGTRSVGLLATVASGLTANIPAFLFNNNTDAALLFDSRL